jgi:putative IMPACT (imprinted ancient) family translation regulator
VCSKEEVELFRATLTADRKIAKATHNMVAYRIVDARGIEMYDNDEDGEAGAGHRLSELLRLMNATNVVVMVSRWYGGIQLGPDRFRHIQNSARTLLELAGYGASPARRR